MSAELETLGSARDADSVPSAVAVSVGTASLEDAVSVEPDAEVALIGSESTLVAVDVEDEAAVPVLVASTLDSPPSAAVEDAEASTAVLIAASPVEETDSVAVALAAPPEADTVELVDPSPVIPPVAPVASIRARASPSVSHVTEVPRELTRGSAKHCVPPEHSVAAHVPPTH